MAGLQGWRDLADRSAVRLAWLWAGLSIGVAFVATPAKFLAPSLTLPVALDVGRHTFHIYNRLELGLALLAIALAVGSTERRRRVIGFLVPAAVVVIQALWLIPALDTRVLMVQTGQTPPPSHLHSAYVAAETVKILALFVAALVQGRPRRHRSEHGHDWISIPPLERT